MLPDRHVWIFNGARGRFPGGVFLSRDLAERWIASNRLTGTLTAYPLDEGCFDWALRTGVLTPTVAERGTDPDFIGSFSTASQAHFHYENGILGGQR